MRRGASLVALALLVAMSAAQAQPASPWEWLRDSARGWLGTEDPAAALARLGGTRVLLAADVDDFRNHILLPELRDDVRKIMREARVPYASLAVRDGGIEVRPRDLSFVPAALTALAATAGPAHDAVEIREAGDGVIRLVPADRAIAGRLNGSLDRAVDIVRRRLDGVGPVAAGVQRDGADRIRVVLPGVTDPAQLMHLMAPTARLEFRLVDVSMTPAEAQRNGVPASSEVLLAAKTREPYLVYRATEVGGQDIAEATAGFDQNGRPDVDFRLNARGARVFGRLTQENVGRPFAIVLDNEVLSAPVIQTPILGGFGQITGNFTVEEAKRLATLMRAGMLPVRLTVIEQTTVAPAKN